jgi:teichuronic acid biosynthesis glycosyltransferase TuaC
MKVLFISSGNAKSGICTIVRNQGDSLIEAGINIEYFNIKGKGIVSYIRHIFILYRKIRNTKYDIFHAHYSLSAFTATLAGCTPLIVSLMGSDTKTNKIIRTIILFFARTRWKAIIVKSGSMKSDLGIDDVHIIPNGVDLDKVKPVTLDRTITGEKKILFPANPDRYSKYFQLAEKAVAYLKENHSSLQVVHSVSHDEIIQELNNSDVVLLTSRYEGSPNIVKEAMACNRPIVATDVGDVKWVIGNTDGCYITSHEPENIADTIKLALKFSETKGTTSGRERIIELGLDSETVAKKVIGIYEEVLASH